jgi:hypothetical protein
VIHDLQICSLILNKSSYTRLSFTMVFSQHRSNGAEPQGALILTLSPHFSIKFRFMV